MAGLQSGISRQDPEPVRPKHVQQLVWTNGAITPAISPSNLMDITEAPAHYDCSKVVWEEALCVQGIPGDLSLCPPRKFEIFSA